MNVAMVPLVWGAPSRKTRSVRVIVYWKSEGTRVPKPALGGGGGDTIERHSVQPRQVADVQRHLISQTWV